jgi:hypothetical protein
MAAPRKSAAPLTPPVETVPVDPPVVHTPDPSLTADPPVLAPETEPPTGPTPTPVVVTTPVAGATGVGDGPTWTYGEPAPTTERTYAHGQQMVDLQRDNESLRAERDAARQERDEWRAIATELRASQAAVVEAEAGEGRLVTPTNPHTKEPYVRDAPPTVIEAPVTHVQPLR